MRCSTIVFALALALVGCEKDSSNPETKDQPKAAAQDEGGEATPKEPEKPKLPAAEELLDKAVAAAGGQEAFSRIHSYYYEGQLVVAGQKLESQAKVWWKDGDFYTEQEMIGVGMVQAGKSGDAVWSSDPVLGMRRLEGKEGEQAGWLSDIMLAVGWKRYFEKAETIEEREDPAGPYYVVRLTSKSGASIDLHFDAKSGLQRGLEVRQQTPMGELPVTLLMQDYRDVEGAKLAFKQVTDMGIATATLEIEKLELNPEISTARFQMPHADAETVTKPPAE